MAVRMVGRVVGGVVLLCSGSFGQVLAGLDGAEAGRALDYLNSQRQLAGMSPLNTNVRLGSAAESHASYLAINHLTGHYQRTGDAGFTGVEVKDRTAAAGYGSLSVTENVSSGQESGAASIDGLMSAIYHRIGFLDFSIDEIGAGAYMEEGGNNRFVYNMGNSQLVELCNGSEPFTTGSYYSGVCLEEKRIASESYDEASSAPHSANPRWVVWPADGALDVPPAFYEESPDPLPDYSVSGYPLSIHLNPDVAESVVIENLKLVRASDGAAPGELRLMDQESDPNKQFKSGDRAIFPLQRLEWGAAYRAEALLTVDGERRYYGWSFNTRSTGMTTYTLEQDGQQFEVASGSKFAIYMPPRNGSDSVNSFRWSMTSATTLDVSLLDHNTLSLEISGQAGNRATVEAGDRRFDVVIVEGEPLVATSVATGGEGCPGGVELARYQSESGLLELPLVQLADGPLYRVQLNHQGSYRFLLAVADEVAGLPHCRSAVYEPQQGKLTIPHLKLLAGSGEASSYRVELSVSSGGSGLTFELASAVALP